MSNYVYNEMKSATVVYLYDSLGRTVNNIVHSTGYDEDFVRDTLSRNIPGFRNVTHKSYRRSI